MSLSPWSVKGVDPEAREAAKIAARRSGLTVGQWLSQTIRAAASEQLRSGGRGAPQMEYAATAAYPPSSSGYESGAQGHTSPPPAPTMQAIFESIQKLTSRIEAAESTTAAALAPLAEQVDHLSKQVEEVKDQAGISTAPVERAVMRLSERLQKIEENPKPANRRSRGWNLFGFSR